MAKTMVKLRAFLDAEAKRHSGSSGIKPTEPVPMKILKPTRYSLYTRLGPIAASTEESPDFNRSGKQANSMWAN
jgi:hypothetical protein